MINNKQASELISKSLHGMLSLEEQSAMEDHLAQDEDARAFADLSAAIHNSVADIGILSQAGGDSVGPGLSDAAKSRLKDSVLGAIARQSQAGSGVPVDSNLAQTIDNKSDHNTPVSRPQALNSEPGDFRESKSRFTLLREIGQGGLGRV